MIYAYHLPASGTTPYTPKTPNLPTINVAGKFISVGNSFNIKDDLKALGARFGAYSHSWDFRISNREEQLSTIEKLSALGVDMLLDMSGWREDAIQQVQETVPLTLMRYDVDSASYVPTESWDDFIWY